MKSILCFLAIILLAIGINAQSEQQDRPLRIISKPNAVYPVAAQRAMVTGNVILRISFLANGTIGAVDCVNDDGEKRLFEKYGLIESAVNAARKVTFEAKISKGVAVDTSARLVYGFHMR